MSLKEKDVFSIQHGFLVRKPRTRCLSSLNNMSGLRGAGCRRVQDTKSARKVFREYIKEFIGTNVNKKKKTNVKWNKGRLVTFQTSENEVASGR